MNNWENLILKLKNKYDDQTYNTWIKLLKYLGEDENFIYIYPGGELNYKVIDNIYKEDIEIFYSKIIGKNKKCKLIEEKDLEKYQNIAFETEKQPSQKTNLNPKYTFDNFVVGSKNQFAHAASLAVAQKPGIDFNPLFLYGRAGLGKTHLLQAIGNYIKNNDPTKKIQYITTENFTNEFIKVIQKGNIEKFKRKYRSVDVLLIDDIQFLSEKDRTQEEFFHTFNELKESKKHIIITSDRPPKEIKDVEERLISRFSQGLVADIAYPDYETRVAILKKKAEKKSNNIDEEVFNYIATHVKDNIRVLEGCLNRVIAFSKLCASDKHINLESCKDILSEFIEEKSSKVIDHNYIINIVCNYFDIKEKDIFSTKRSKAIAYPRQIAMYIIRNITELSLPKIGDVFGRDHSTVIHAYDKISKEIDNNDKTKYIVDDIIEKINS